MNLLKIYFHLNMVASGQNGDLRCTTAQIPTPFLLRIYKMKVWVSAKKST